MSEYNTKLEYELLNDAESYRETIGIQALEIEQLKHTLESLQTENETIKNKLRDLGICWKIVNFIGNAGNIPELLRSAINDADKVIKKGGVFCELRGSSHYPKSSRNSRMSRPITKTEG